MQPKHWIEWVKHAGSLSSAADVVDQYMSNPAKDHQVVMQLIAAFRERRLREVKADEAWRRSHAWALHEVGTVLSPTAERTNTPADGPQPASPPSQMPPDRPG